MKPDWLKVKSNYNKNREEVEALLSKLSLHTVCEEASCPNMMECFSRRTATFMILGRVCSRNCTFCDVNKGNPENVDEKEPQNVAKAVKQLGLKHIVITSVTRDDLEDGGALQFARAIREVKELTPNVTIEVLIPDFKGDIEALKKVVNAKPEIINHNIETIPRLYPTVRPMAIYERSLKLLENVKKLSGNILTKSGIMVGLGESKDEIIEVISDLRAHACDILTIGQYLSPSKNHHPVIEYVHPSIFEEYKDIALKEGFVHVSSAPLVRSSYHAEEALK